VQRDRLDEIPSRCGSGGEISESVCGAMNSVISQRDGMEVRGGGEEDGPPRLSHVLVSITLPTLPSQNSEVTSLHSKKDDHVVSGLAGLT
jgi:hypothetical protein